MIESIEVYFEIRRASNDIFPSDFVWRSIGKSFTKRITKETRIQQFSRDSHWQLVRWEQMSGIKGTRVKPVFKWMFYCHEKN